MNDREHAGHARDRLGPADLGVAARTVEAALAPLDDRTSEPAATSPVG